MEKFSVFYQDVMFYYLKGSHLVFLGEFLYRAGRVVRLTLLLSLLFVCFLSAAKYLGMCTGLTVGDPNPE